MNCLAPKEANTAALIAFCNLPPYSILLSRHALTKDEVHSVFGRSRDHSFVGSILFQDISFTVFT